jgi:hypothetical protein
MHKGPSGLVVKDSDHKVWSRAPWHSDTQLNFGILLQRDLCGWVVDIIDFWISWFL